MDASPPEPPTTEPSAQPAAGLSIDLSYRPEEDRIRLTLRPAAAAHSQWWLTRRITLALMRAWVDKLQEVPLPEVTAAPWMPSLNQHRDVSM